MTLQIDALPRPLRMDADGVIRVGDTRVTLDTVILVFNAGVSPEEIVDRYPGVSLADVRDVLNIYQQHHATIDEYLAERQRAAAIAWRELEERTKQSGIKERLLQRAAGNAK